FTALTLTSGASATASARVSWVKAALDTPYGSDEPLARRPAMEATLTMHPRALFRYGAAARDAYQGPMRLIPRISRQTSSVTASRSGKGMKRVVPALL